MGRAPQRRSYGADLPGRPHTTSRGSVGPVDRAREGGEIRTPSGPAREEAAAADPNDPRRDVLAVILTDGTIQLVSDPAAKEPERPRWNNGRLQGPGWVMWWELRSWEEDGRT